MNTSYISNIFSVTMLLINIKYKKLALKFNIFAISIYKWNSILKIDSIYWVYN